MDENVDSNVKGKIDKVKSLMKSNRAAALGMAVLLTLGTTLMGCGARTNSDEEDDDSYYSSGYSSGYVYGGGGGYFYSRGSSFKSGSWSKTSSGYTGSSYSSSRSGSIGG